MVQFLAGASVAVRTIGSNCWVHGQAGYLHQFTIFIRSRLQLIFSTDYSLNFEQITFHILSNTVIILRRVQLKVVGKKEEEKKAERLKLKCTVNLKCNGRHALSASEDLSKSVSLYILSFL